MKKQIHTALFSVLLALGASQARADIPFENTIDEMTTNQESVANNLGSAVVPLNSVAVVRVHEPKKTLGKGIADRTTGERMELACIGDRIDGVGLERKCDVLRFLYENAGGEMFLIGPTFTIRQKSEAHQSINNQMKDAFAYWHVSKKVDQKRSFMVSRLVYGKLFFHERDLPNISNNTQTGLQAGLLLAQGFGTKLLMAGAATQGMAIAGFVVGGLLAPVILDVAILPVTAIIDWKNGTKIWGFSARDITTLQKRSNPAWSLRPKKTRSKRFQQLLKSLIRINTVSGAEKKAFHGYVFSKNTQPWERVEIGASLTKADPAELEAIFSRASNEATALLNGEDEN